MKKCSICNKNKELLEFHRNTNSKDGHKAGCKECLNLKNRIYKKNNKEKVLAYNKEYDKNRKERIEYKKNYMKIYRSINKKILNEQCKKYAKNRSKIDINYRLSLNLRKRLHSAIRNKFKSGSAVRDLGCSIEFLKQYLESKFQPGMTWDNWGRDGWHIDHIIPLSKFNLFERKETEKACHYTNLQPLWAIDNLIKGSK